MMSNEKAQELLLLTVEEEAKALIPQSVERDKIVATLREVATRMNIYLSGADVAVTTQDEADGASAILKNIAQDKADIEETTEAWKSRAFKFHRSVTAFIAGFTDPLTDAQKRRKAKIIAFENEKARKAEEERARLQAIADAEAEMERRKLRAEAKVAETKEERRALKEQAAAVAAPVVNVEAQKTAGVSLQKRWDVRPPIDEDAFFKALAVDRNLRGYVDIGISKLARAKANNSRLEVPGVTFYQKTV
jgi:hypothetical protein